MFISWGVPSNREESYWDEYVLCYLRLYDDGNLHMRPGLSNFPCLALEPGNESDLRSVYCFTSLDGKM